MNPFRAQPSGERQPIRAELPAAKGASEGVVALRLYDPLDAAGGEWGVSAKEFVAVLDGLPDDTAEIKVLINSPGGQVWEGLAIINALRAHPAKITAVVEGIAASAAADVAVSADELVIARNAELFIHKAWGLAVGNGADMAKMAADLEHEDRNRASLYAAKAGGTVEEWLTALAAETWYSADEAVSAGLADRVLEPPAGSTGAKGAKAKFDLSVFAHASAPAASQRVTAAITTHNTQTPAASVDGQTEQKEQDMSDKLTDGLRQRLGLADENADEDAILAAVDKVLAEKPQGEGSSPAQLQKLAAASGAVIVDQGVWAQAQAQIEEGVQAARKLREQERDAAVHAAVSDGRIPPVNADHWKALWDKDPKGTSEVIANLRKNVVPIEALGYGDDTGDGDDMGEFAGMFRPTGKGR